MAHGLYSPEEIDLVMEKYETTPSSEIAEQLGVPVGRVWRLAQTLCLYKSKDCIAAMAREKLKNPNHGARRTCFQKGHVPANKGKKVPGYAPGRMGTTQFKKGQINHNKMPIGAERWIGSGTGGQEEYLYRKVSDVRYVPYTVNWKPVHYLLWEKKHGPVPKGHNLIFKDGNRENIVLSNLELVSRAEWMLRHSVHKLPEELKEVIRLKGSIKRVIKRRKKNAEE